MNPERWKRIEELFAGADDLPPEQQQAWLEANCDDASLAAEVVDLLRAGAGTSAIEEPIRGAVSMLAGRVRERESIGAGGRIGPYEIIGEVGRGGMGTVFRARRVDGVFDKEVAIKIVNSPGVVQGGIQARFRREREILARLDHPNIARILDGGNTAGGVPFLVMDYVQGLPLIRHAVSKQLPLDERIALFLKVCAAVQYAHQQMVVHRDLKPGNIVVDESGEPRLLDFGIAKLLAVSESEDLSNPATIDAMRPMTPQYASPEQVRGDTVTAASDVYSLGAVLYELLSGRTAFHEAGQSPVTYALAICETEPKPPSAIVSSESPIPAGRLRGDLDHIVLRALHRDPKLRYGSVDQLAEDLRRYQAFLPVRAAAQTRIYRALKFARRNRTTILAATLVSASLLAGFFAALHQARRAERRASQLRHLTNAFIFEVHDAVEKLPGATEARRLILAKAVEQLEILRREADDPASRLELASAFRKIGNALGGVMEANLGDREAAEKHYRAARDLLESVLASSPGNLEARLELAELLRVHATLQQYRGDRQSAVALLNEALERIGPPGDRASAAEMAAAAAIRTELSDIQRSGGIVAAALQNSETAVRLMESAVGRRPGRYLQMSLSAAYASLAKSRQKAGDLAGALAASRRNTVILEELFAARPDDRNVMQRLLLAHGHDGDILGWPGNANLGDRAGSEQAYRKAASMAERLTAADGRDSRAKVDLAIALTRLGNVIAPGRNAEALEIYRRGLAIFEDLSVQDPANAMTLSNMSYLLRMAAKRREEAGEPAGALDYLRRAQKLNRAVLARKPTEPVHMRLLYVAMEDEALILKRMGNAAQSRTVARQLWAEAHREIPGRDQFNLAIVRARASRLLAQVSAPEEACGHYRESLQYFDTVQRNKGFTSVLENERTAVEQTAANCR